MLPGAFYQRRAIVCLGSARKLVARVTLNNRFVATGIFLLRCLQISEPIAIIAGPAR